MDLSSELGTVRVGQADIDQQHLDIAVEPLELLHGGCAAANRGDLVLGAAKDIRIDRTHARIVFDDQNVRTSGRRGGLGQDGEGTGWESRAEPLLSGPMFPKYGRLPTR